MNHMDDILLKHGIELPADYQPGARIAVKNANPAHRFTCLTPSARTKDANGRVVYRAKASAYGVVDRHDEVIDQGAFAAYAKENPEVVLLWGHMHHQYPVGVITRGYETVGSFDIDFELLNEDLQVLVSAGAVKFLSVGFIAREVYIDKDPDGRERLHISKADLLEVSLVNVPANPGAVILGAEVPEQKDAAPEAATIEYGPPTLNDDGSVTVEVTFGGEQIGDVVISAEDLAAAIEKAPDAGTVDDTTEEPAGEVLDQDTIDWLAARGIDVSHLVESGNAA